MLDCFETRELSGFGLGKPTPAQTPHCTFEPTELEGKEPGGFTENIEHLCRAAQAKDTEHVVSEDNEAHVVLL